MKNFLIPVILAAFALILGACTSNVDCNYNGMNTTNGQAIAHVNTVNTGVQLFGTFPVGPDASLTKTFNDFNKEAKRLNASKVRVVQSDLSHSWNLFPPFTWIITPTISEVAGDVYPN